VADNGAGTGSVTVEMARKAHEGVVFAVEKNAAAADLARKNIARFRAFNATVLQGEAPELLDALPPPDKAFIGGSGGNLAGIVAGLLEKNPRLRIVIAAVTLGTLHEAAGELEARGCSPDILCVNVAAAVTRGRHRMMKAENPVYIISGQKNAR
jgi:precorrin-6Y C5,15-methyltransferase (decarboxylating)